MRLKDRMLNNKKDNVAVQQEPLNDFEDIFIDSLQVSSTVVELISSKKNIVFVSEPKIDKFLVLKYFNFILTAGGYDVSFYDQIPADNSSSDLNVNIFTSPSLPELVKIMEYYMRRYGSFVYWVDFVLLDNILQKIKIAVSINYPNLSEGIIDFLLGSSNLTFVYLDKNENGLLYISKIENVISDESICKIEEIYNMQNISEDEKENIAENINEETDFPSEIYEETEEIIEDIYFEEEPNQDTEDQEDVQQDSKKINKYKLLKEKIKNKKIKLSE